MAKTLRFVFLLESPIGVGHAIRVTRIIRALNKRNSKAVLHLVSSCDSHFADIIKDLETKLPSLVVHRLPLLRNRTLSKVSRPPSSENGLPWREIRDARAAKILEIIQSHRPHVLVGEHSSRGFYGDLLPALRWARSVDIRTALILRDILDDPEMVLAHWQRFGIRKNINNFDKIFVCGRPEVFDFSRAYGLEELEVERRLVYVGYVSESFKKGASADIVVTVGGGIDGMAFIERAVASLSSVSCEQSLSCAVFLGSQNAQSTELSAQLKGLPSWLSIRPFSTFNNPVWHAGRLLISMGGYQTAADILPSQIPAIVLPRTGEEAEQYMRARALMEQGWWTLGEEEGSAFSAQIAALLDGRLDGGRFRSVPKGWRNGADNIAKKLICLAEGSHV